MEMDRVRFSWIGGMSGVYCNPSKDHM